MTSDRPIVRNQSERRISRLSMIVNQYSLLSLTQHLSCSQKKVYLLIHCRKGLAGKVAFVTLTSRVVFSLLCFSHKRLAQLQNFKDFRSTSNRSQKPSRLFLRVRCTLKNEFTKQGYLFYPCFGCPEKSTFGHFFCVFLGNSERTP